MRFFKNRTVLGMIFILLAFAIAFGVTPMVNKSMAARTNVIKVVKNIAKGEIITDAKLVVVEMGAYNLPKGVVTDKKSVVGKYAMTDLYPEEMLLQSKASAKPDETNDYLYHLGDKKSMSITIKSFAAGLSGKLQKGDVITLMAVGYGDNRETLQPMELKYIRVLASTTDKGVDLDKGMVAKKDNAEVNAPVTLTLLVDDTQAKCLGEFEESAKLHACLVYRGPEKEGNKYLIEQAEMLKTLPATKFDGTKKLIDGGKK